MFRPMDIPEQEEAPKEIFPFPENKAELYSYLIEKVESGSPKEVLSEMFRTAEKKRLIDFPVTLASVIIEINNKELSAIAFKTALELSDECFLQSSIFISSFFSGESLPVEAELIVSSIVTHLEGENINEDIFNKIVEQTARLYAKNGEELDPLILKYLDFSDKNNYARTGIFLEFVQKLFQYAEIYSLDAPGQKILGILKGKTENAEGSYFLHMRTKQMIERLSGKYHHLEDTDKEVDHEPFLLTKGVYAIKPTNSRYVSGSVEYFVSEQNDANEIESKLQELSRLQAEVHRTAKQLDMTTRHGEVVQRFIPQDMESFEKIQAIRNEILSFFKKKLETSGDVSEQKDYGYLLSKPMRELFEKEFGFSISELSVSEQFHFLNFSKQKEVKDFDAVRKFALKYGKVGLKTFLSLEYGGELGDDIIMLGEKLKEEDARAIFDKYGEVVDATEKVAGYLKEKFGTQKDYSPELVQSIQDRLMRKAREILVEFSKEIKDLGKIPSSQQIREKLQSIKSEILVFAASFKELSASDGLSLTDISSIEFGVHEDMRGLEKEKKEMKEIFIRNRPAYSRELLKKTLSEFEQAMERNQSEFHILKHDGEVLAFMRFDKLPNGNLYAGSLNVRTEIRGSAIGQAFLKEILVAKSKEASIEGVVYSKNPILKHYVENFGFRIDGEIPDYNGTGELFYKIVLDKKST